MRLRLLLLLIGLVLAPVEAFSQDIVVSLTPNNGPPGTAVNVDLIQGGPFTTAQTYAFSFGDDLASPYSRTPA